MTTKNRKAQNALESEGTVDEAGKKDIFASSISKYVYKSGRLTIRPELVFQRCGILPGKPVESEPESASTVEDSGLIDLSIANGTETPSSSESFNNVLQSSLSPTNDGSKGWTWEMIEKERQQGMKIVDHFGNLDQLKGAFTGDSKPALGAYRDLLWA